MEDLLWNLWNFLCIQSCYLWIETFTSSFLFCINHKYSASLTSLAITSDTMLNRSSQSWHNFFVHNLRGKSFFFFSIKRFISHQILNVFYHDRNFFLFLVHWKSFFFLFIMNVCCILLNAFLVSIGRTTGLFILCINMLIELIDFKIWIEFAFQRSSAWAWCVKYCICYQIQLIAVLSRIFVFIFMKNIDLFFLVLFFPLYFVWCQY